MVVRYHKTIKRADSRGGAFHIRIRNRTYSRELVPREQSLGSYSIEIQVNVVVQKARSGSTNI
ncbi:hypothetical protein M405DRAFT_572880 [Rhizopogon salebrosus TDB-379]|nr:hypothetical protein M405DRAFT_572880 [Rhizopogon salebrosus TDB-379]